MKFNWKEKPELVAHKNTETYFKEANKTYPQNLKKKIVDGKPYTQK